MLRHWLKRAQMVVIGKRDQIKRINEIMTSDGVVFSMAFTEKFLIEAGEK